jgi:hypothetical protein
VTWDMYAKSSRTKEHEEMAIRIKDVDVKISVRKA